MTQSIPSISKLSITGLISPSLVTPLTDAINVAIPFNFSAITVLNAVTGTYTPANDTKTIYTFGASEKPNFLLLVVDQPSVLELVHSSAGNVIDSLPFFKAILIPLSALTTGTYQTLILNGATTGICPMQQGVAMNYTVFACTGLVT